MLSITVSYFFCKSCFVGTPVWHGSSDFLDNSFIFLPDTDDAKMVSTILPTFLRTTGSLMPGISSRSCMLLLLELILSIRKHQVYTILIDFFKFS